MDISATPKQDALLLTVEASRIDAASAVAFKDTVRALAGRAPRVVLDISAVGFLDSSGLGAIVGVLKLLGPDQTLEFAGPTANVERVFRLTRMDNVFRIHATVEDAFPGLEHAS